MRSNAGWDVRYLLALGNCEDRHAVLGLVADQQPVSSRWQVRFGCVPNRLLDYRGLLADGGQGQAGKQNQGVRANHILFYAAGLCSASRPPRNP